jgi:hypothetical protein
MQKAAAATLFCHLQLINLEQEQNMVSCKAKINLEDGINLTQRTLQLPRQPLWQATTFLLSIRTYVELNVTLETIYQKSFGTKVVLHKMIPRLAMLLPKSLHLPGCHLGYTFIKVFQNGFKHTSSKLPRINNYCRKSCVWVPTRIKRTRIHSGPRSLDSQKFRERGRKRRSMSLRAM